MPRKEYYEQLKTENRCVNCGRKLEEGRLGKTTCESCAVKHREYVSESVLFFSKYNICPRCGTNKLFGDEKNCPECRAKLWEYGIKYREEHPEFVEQKKATDKARKANREALGLCVQCGKAKEDNGLKTCEKCRQYNKMRMRKHRGTRV